MKKDKNSTSVEIIHTPVLKEEVFRLLNPKHLLVDATVGEGGHAEMFLEESHDLTVVGTDADANILEKAKGRLKPFEGRVWLFHKWFNAFFKDYPSDLPRPDAILFDLGISLFHYEESTRGFTFRKDESLDMRLGEGLEISAVDIINEYPETELANLIYNYGEERYSRRIARKIVAARRESRVTSTEELKEIVWEAVPPQYRHRALHPATKTFQALRIAVNGELERLKSALADAFQVLLPGGRMGVISFHSLEDRIVKNFFKDKNKACSCPPEWPVCKCGGVREGEIVTKKPIEPSKEERERNKPARSAKLRVLKKLKDEEL